MRNFIVGLTICFTASSAVAEPVKTFVFPKQEKHCHGSTIVELPNGDMLAAWFFGSGERTADDVLVQGARLKNGETEWSKVFTMADTPNAPDCNPVLFLDDQARVWLFWISVLANKWETSLLMYRRAEEWDGDGAPAWSWQGVITLQPGEDFPQKMRAGFDAVGYEQEMWAEYALPYEEMLVEAAGDKLKRRMGWMTRTHAHTLSSGRMILPLYSDGFNVSMMAYSDDDGKTWQASDPIVGLGPIQPAVAQRSDGALVAFMRDSGPAPKRIMKATSKDEGASWTVARDTKERGSSASVQVRALEDGRWLMIHNDTEFGRHRLAVSLSEDEGETWGAVRHVEDHKLGGGSYSYPSIIQAADGKVHVTYSHHDDDGRTIAHAWFDVDWVAE